MPKRVKTPDDMIRVYSLLAEGNIQARVVEVTGIRKDRVSRLASKLVKEGYLEIESRGKDIVYVKSKNGPLLDSIRVAESCNINARGVTKVASKTHQVKTVNVHHILYKFNVVKEGTVEYLPDTINGKEVRRPFLVKKNGPYRGNVYRHYGQVQYFETFLTAFYEKTPKQAFLYIFAPELDLSPEEWKTHKWKEMTLRAVTEISAFIQEKGGWQLGLPEETEWKKHFAVDDPALMKGFADHLFMKSRDGKAWTSDSGGAHEYESSEEEYIDVHLNIPGEIIQIKGTVKEIAEAFREVANAMMEILEVKRLDVELHAQETQDQVKKTLEHVKEKTEEKTQPAEASLTGNDSDNEVMYR